MAKAIKTDDNELTKEIQRFVNNTSKKATTGRKATREDIMKLCDSVMPSKKKK